MKLIRNFLLMIALALSSFAMAAVDLNTGTVAEFQTISGVGPAKAKAIVDYRQKNGDYKSISELKNVKGIGDKLYNKIKGEVEIGKTSTKSDKKAVVGVVNINTADEKELSSLPGVGAAKVKAIMKYRAATPFNSVDDLENVKGFSKDTVNRLRDMITVQ